MGGVGQLDPQQRGGAVGLHRQLQRGRIGEAQRLHAVIDEDLVAAGQIRDLSGVVEDISPATIAAGVSLGPDTNCRCSF